MPLTPDEVHLWRASLDVTAAHVTRLGRTLAPDEHERAARYRFERDRVRDIVARGTLRVILGRYLDLDAAGLRFVYGPQGKPALAPEHGADEDTLSFNLSPSRVAGASASTSSRLSPT